MLNGWDNNINIMSEQYFQKTYKNFNKFIEIKEKYSPSSFQSRRLCI